MKNFLLPVSGDLMMRFMYRGGRCHLFLLLVLFFAALPACSSSKKHESAYLQSELLTPLKIPPGLEAPRTNDFMTIPDVTAAQNADESAAQIIPDDGRAIDAPPDVLLKEDQ